MVDTLCLGAGHSTSEVGERAKAMSFVFEALEFLACMCLTKCGESEKQRIFVGVQKDNRRHVLIKPEALLYKITQLLTMSTK